METGFVGRHAAPTCPASAGGLWIVRQLCDRVELRSSPAGTVVRIHLSRA